MSLEEIDNALSRVRSPKSRQRRRERAQGLSLSPQSPKESRPSSRALSMGLASARDYEKELESFTRSRSEVELKLEDCLVTSLDRMKRRKSRHIRWNSSYDAAPIRINSL